MDTSKLFSVNIQDAVKGLIVAVLGVIIAATFDITVTGSLPTIAQWKAIGITGLSAGLGYLIKNFFSNNTGQVLKKDEVK